MVPYTESMAIAKWKYLFGDEFLKEKDIVEDPFDIHTMNLMVGENFSENNGKSLIEDVSQDIHKFQLSKYLYTRLTFILIIGH